MKTTASFDRGVFTNVKLNFGIIIVCFVILSFIYLLAILQNYVDFLKGKVGEEIFSEMYEDVDVVLDQPACTLWNIILKQFPDAKVRTLFYHL